MNNDERETAYHEAGHAVIATVLRLELVHVTIDADHESAGHAIADSTDDPERAHSAAIYALAGMAAQLRAGGSPKKVEVGGTRDTLRAEQVARAAGFDVALSRDEATRLVKDHWAEIERVARGLLEWRTLDFSEVEWLMEGEHAFAELAALRAFLRSS